MLKLYSKDALVSSVKAMKSGGRLAHAFLLTGEKGVGKKVSAKYIAMTLLCEHGTACGECRHCRRIIAGTHPDVIMPEKTGKSQIYSRDTFRFVCSDAYVSPNDCDAKVYIFTDCESIEEATQNLMLKLIEEPPDTAYFIFTAKSRSVFLPTILSRVISIGIAECSEEDCRSALTDMGYSSDRIDEAAGCFHGNIGNCVDYLDGGETARNVELCRKIVSAVVSGNEYDLLTALHGIGEDRKRIRLVLELVDKVVRDACVKRLENGLSMIGCDPVGADELSKKMSMHRAEVIHEAIGRTISRCGMNINVPTEMSAFACTVMD